MAFIRQMFLLSFVMEVISVFGGERVTRLHCVAFVFRVFFCFFLGSSFCCELCGVM